MMMNVSKPARFTLALLFGLLTVPAVATTGIVSDKSDDFSIKVPVADLNLSNKNGVEKLYQRLQTAARQICGSRDYRTAGSLRQSRLNQQCYVEALDSAVNEIDDRILTEIHTS
jgi:UrcA family protein